MQLLALFLKGLVKWGMCDGYVCYEWIHIAFEQLQVGEHPSCDCFAHLRVDDAVIPPEDNDHLKGLIRAPCKLSADQDSRYAVAILQRILALLKMPEYNIKCKLREGAVKCRTGYLAERKRFASEASLILPCTRRTVWGL